MLLCMKLSSPPRNAGAALSALAILVIAATLFAGCTGTGTEQQQTAEPQTISVTGSTTVLPIAQAAADAYMSKDSLADIQVSGGGSGVGVQAVGEGTADIGMSSRDVKAAEKEKYPNLVEQVVAIDGIAVIVNPSNQVASLTLDQVRGIYNGTYTNWNAVGGSAGEIVVIGRDSASGTREYFSESVMQTEDFVQTPAREELERCSAADRSPRPPVPSGMSVSDTLTRP